MKLRIVIFLATVMTAISMLSGCGSKTSTPNAVGRQATVILNDGSTFAGTVKALSPDSISLQASTGESRTYPMNQVGSVQYGPPPADAAGQGTSATLPPAPAQATAPVSQPAASAAAQPPPQSAPAPAAPTPSAPVEAPPPAVPVAQAPPPPPVYRTIPAGATIAVRNTDTIDSQTAQPGQTFAAVVEQDVVDVDGKVAIPHGTNATLVVNSATGQGKLQGQSDLAVDVSSVQVGAHRYRLETSDFAAKGKQGVGTNKRTGVFAGGGAALGGIIGAVAGGGKGAAIGLLSGAGAGTATQALTRGKAVKIPSETLLQFKLQAPVKIHALD